MLPTTPEIQEFRTSKVFTEELSHLFQTPTVKAWFKAADTLCRPRTIPVPVAGVAHDTTIAHAYCELVGVSNTLRVLRSMAFGRDQLSPEEQEYVEEQPFMHNLPPELQQAPKNR